MAKPEQWRKKSVVIEAIQWTGSNAVTLLDWIKPEARQEGAVIVIPTLEGDHEASLGDWIIKGVAGEFYPCKPDIFTMTYERASPAVIHEEQNTPDRVAFWNWLPLAYLDGHLGAEPKFTKYNMEVAHAAGWQHALEQRPAPTLAEAVKMLADAIDRMTEDEYLDAAYEVDEALQTHDRGKAAAALRRIAEGEA